MPMADIFDFFAGTSTGSILATAMVTPKEIGSRMPKWWASEASSIYEENAAAIFNQSKLGAWMKVITWIAYIVLSAALFFALGSCIYHPKNKLKALFEAKDLLKQLEEQNNLKNTKEDNRETVIKSNYSVQLEVVEE